MSPSGRLANSYRGLRVFVTGHTGFKGTWLCAWLKRLGAEVTGFSDRIPTEPSHFETLGLEIADLRGDIADPQAIADAIRSARPVLVFHLAAQSLVRRAYSDPIETYRTNLMGSLALFEACRAAGGVRAVVSATTDKVYRNHEWDRGYREEDELGGADPYSASKSCVELMTASYRETLLPAGDMLIASVRAGNVIGGGDWAEDRLVPDLIRAAFGGTRVSIRNPDSTRPWQHVLDPLLGYLVVGERLLAGDRTVAEAWNFGPASRAEVRVANIVEAVRAMLPQLEAVASPDADDRKESGLLQLDSAKAAARLGWRTQWDRVMLERTIAWYRAYHERQELLTFEQIDAYMMELDRAS
ncbi:MAG: CDP-glucose 4,6-dehydratase [Sphingosinicella sp.]